MKKTFLFFLLVIAWGASIAQTDYTVVQWDVNSIETIGGHQVSLLGAPVVLAEEGAVQFDGIDDGIFVPNNPMSGATEFTVEVIFKPYANGGTEQRFVHFQQDDNNRILIELRITDDGKWFLDTFIKSGSSNKTLFAETFLHPVDQWAHAALVYKDNVMTHYVNGEMELTSDVIYAPVSSGQTSLGVRQTKVSWFNGAIKTLRVSHKALAPADFITVETTGIEKKNDSKIEIIQLFPNIISSDAKINLLVKESCQLSMKIYDLNGKEVSVLENNRYEKGNYMLPININSVSSGVYLLSVSDGENTTRQKFIVRK